MYRVKALKGDGRYSYSTWYKTIDDAARKVFSLGLEGIWLEVTIESDQTDYERGYKGGYRTGYQDGLVKSHVKTIKGVCKNCLWCREHKGEYICDFPRDSASGLPWTRPLTGPNLWCSEFQGAEDEQNK